ncbi:MAG: fumarylacetoacetate hydrolase family protein [Phycisphaerales bacterium]
MQGRERGAGGSEHVLGYCCANDVSAVVAERRGRGAVLSGEELRHVLSARAASGASGRWGSAGAVDRVPGERGGAPGRDDGGHDFPGGEADRGAGQGTTLAAGTVILTGTPSGVGFGRKPQVFLRAGDVVEVEIEKIGVLGNRVVNG